MADGEQGRPRSWRGAVWAVGFAVPTSAGLAALAWGLLVMDALVALGLALVAAEGDVGLGGGYGRALALGVAVNLLLAATVALTLPRTPARGWPSWLQGLASAGIAALVSAAALLLLVGISPIPSPIAFVSAL